MFSSNVGMRKWVLAGLICVFVPCILGLQEVVGVVQTGIFRDFTNHISRQIVKDKQQFVLAESCTQWFYRKLKRKNRSPSVEQISFPAVTPLQIDTKEEECLSLYPKGLDGARESFSRSQLALMISLNYYRLALVGDRDDDGEYNADELQDLLESFDIEVPSNVAPLEYATSLNQKFDTVRQAGEFSVLNKGMANLYGKGYRFTSADQVALDQILG